MKRLLFALIIFAALCGCNQNSETPTVAVTSKWEVIKLNDTTYLAVPREGGDKDVQFIKIK